MQVDYWRLWWGLWKVSSDFPYLLSELGGKVTESELVKSGLEI